VFAPRSDLSVCLCECGATRARSVATLGPVIPDKSAGSIGIFRLFAATSSPPGFVDNSLSAAILGDGLEARREELRATLPIRRVVGPADVAALAVHLMINTALTGATLDLDGGQQFVA
jgi:hypothetical protein